MTLFPCAVLIVREKTEDSQRLDPGKRRWMREGSNVSQTRGAGNHRASVGCKCQTSPLVRRAVTKRRVHRRHVTFSTLARTFFHFTILFLFSPSVSGLGLGHSRMR